MQEKTYYQLLGIPSNAELKEIRTRYLALVREFSPETHPDEFESIRQAYEVLSDPEQRKEYDLSLGASEAHVATIEKVHELIAQGAWSKILRQVSKMDEPYRSFYRCVAHFHLDHWDLHVKARDKAINIIGSDSETLAIVSNLLQQMYTDGSDHAQDALSLFDRLIEVDPERIRILWMDYAHILKHLEREADIFPMVEQLLPGDQDAFQLDKAIIVIEWIVFVAEGYQTSVWQKYRGQAVRYLRMADGEDKQQINELIAHVIDDLLDNESVTEAQALAEMMTFIDRKDRVAQDRLLEINEVLEVQTENDKMMEDRKLYPPVGMHVRSLLVEKMGWSADEIDWLDEEPVTQHQRESYAEGIVRLKKAYPASYRMFRDEWQSRLLIVTNSMNREQRRRLLR